MTDSRLSARIAQTLRHRIITGDLTPGSRLGEQRIADELQVSRMPLREVTPQLEIDGLVVSTPRRGTVVTTWTSAMVHDIFDVRIALELAAIRRAAARVAEGDRLEGLREADREAVELGRSDDQYLRAVTNTKYHLAVVDSAGNALLTQLMRAVGWRMTWLFYMTRARDAGIQTDEHHLITDALCAGDLRLAEAMMYAHIESGRQPTLTMMRALLETGDEDA